MTWLNLYFRDYLTKVQNKLNEQVKADGESLWLKT